MFSVLLLGLACSAAEWQWSVPAGQGRAYLWIPADCERVRAVVLAQHNMIEESILEHPLMRAELAKLGMAEVWIVPPQETVFDFSNGAGERTEALLKALAAESGYTELADAPVAPMGHSACASFPWNFAAWKPERTLAILSVKGDAPQTTMTGSGKPNPDWGDRSIDGVPGLMIMGEYEWVEGRLTPALQFRLKHPKAPLAFLALPGRGHFDIEDDLVSFLAMFLRKAAEQRLPAAQGQPLRPVDPAQGWLVERWNFNKGRSVPPAPSAAYTGDATGAFWCFDEEMARATVGYHADQPGKKPQLLGFECRGEILPQSDTHFQVRLDGIPFCDELTFRVAGEFLSSVESGSKNLARWACLPAGTPIGHATGGGPIRFVRITGPVEQLAPDTFQICFNRTCSPNDKRWLDIWLLASHPGDAEYKSAVQQALLTLHPPPQGIEQHISFPAIPDPAPGAQSVALSAASDAGLPVRYYVREGPAEVSGAILSLTKIPPRSRSPVKVTVVAWQWGRDVEPKVKMAAPVERTFCVRAP